MTCKDYSTEMLIAEIYNLAELEGLNVEEVLERANLSTEAQASFYAGKEVSREDLKKIAMVLQITPAFLQFGTVSM